jgi:hypothetical protein
MGVAGGSVSLLGGVSVQFFLFVEHFVCGVG